jgi:hypothetical protein
MPFSGRGFGQYQLTQNPQAAVHVGTVRWLEPWR